MAIFGHLSWLTQRVFCSTLTGLWPEELPETASKVIGLSGPCCSELLLTTVVLMMVKNAAWPTLEALNLNLEMCIRHMDFLDIACRRLISQQW